ncbi:MAG: LytTR family DNA-binding domain-containing protein [Candidatus Dasytiphilus stammeri]
MKAIIVDNEIPVQQELNLLIRQYSRLINIREIFDDGLEVFKYLLNHQVDVIFLDIRIPSLDGIILAHNLKNFVNKPIIIFVTAYKEYAVEAFELEAFDYIIKPWQENRLLTVLHKLEVNWQQKLQKILLPGLKTINLIKNDRFIVTNLSEIGYAEAHEKMTFVYTSSGEYVMPVSITRFCQQLQSSEFFRCHRSYCVNLTHIREIEPWFNQTYLLQLREQNFRVPVSRSKVKEFRHLMRI